MIWKSLVSLKRRLKRRPCSLLKREQREKKRKIESSKKDNTVEVNEGAIGLAFFSKYSPLSK
jgi:hypothetical protein